MGNFNESDIGVRIKNYIRENKLSVELLSLIMQIPEPTLKDRLGGKSSWKISEIVLFATYASLTTDEIIFGDKNYINNSTGLYKKEMADKMKNYLIKEKKYKALGRLTAEGFFDGDIIND